MAANSARPLDTNGLERSLPFDLGDERNDPVAYERAVDCLASAEYYEAAGEGDRGERAVAQVVLNRVHHPAFPSTICEVVYQGSGQSSGCQFTFVCDGSLARRPLPADWQRARSIAKEALAGRVDPSVGMATFYHADWVVPYWASHLDKIARVGTHIFYRWPGYWGSRRSFIQRYAGESAAEPLLIASAHETLDTADVDLPNAVTLHAQTPFHTTSPAGGTSIAEEQAARTVLEDAHVTAPTADAHQYRLLADGAAK